ncbi:MFS transporter [Mesorhizobium retamae]|uniref:MFS transporter n=1 Tax=Mesorhizobium retamae TaxID=2912854 RepID=A0ABS9QLY3_9HYPH|nr:MFS transporter [Mesorhizobium sp. IRAMC:0171]MCG7507599.1 MFS transporter [Mesorhizobium sp. IRAMC:0171]
MTKTDQSPPLLAETARLPAVAYVLTFCIAVIGSNSLVLGPIAPEVARTLGSNVALVMSGSAAFGLGTAASALLMARHVDRLGARRMLLWALVGLSAGLPLSGLSRGVPALAAAQRAAGVASGIALPAIYASAAAVAPPGRESRTIGVVLTGWTLSMVAGVSLSAVVADYVHWRAVYAVVAMLALAASLILKVSRYRDVPAPGPAPQPLAALRIAGVKPLLIACAAFMSAFYGVYGYLGDHLHSDLGEPVSANGIVALVYGIGFGAAALLDGIVDRLGPRRVMPFAFLAVAAVYLGFALAGDSFISVLVLTFVWGLTNHFGLNVLIMRLAAIDPARRGTIMGLNSAVTYLAVFAGTTGFGPLYATRGFAFAALTALVLMLIAAVAGSWRSGDRAGLPG